MSKESRKENIERSREIDEALNSPELQNMAALWSDIIVQTDEIVQSRGICTLVAVYPSTDKDNPNEAFVVSTFMRSDVTEKVIDKMQYDNTVRKAVELFKEKFPKVELPVNQKEANSETPNISSGGFSSN